MVGEHNLHPQCYIVLTGNGLEDGAVSHQLSSALVNRLAMVKHELSLTDWIEDYADKHNVNSMVKAFLQFRPELFHSYSSDMPNEPFGSARSWTALSRCIDAGNGKADPKTKELIAGSGTPVSSDRGFYSQLVGTACTSEFIAFTDRLNNLPTREEIMQNPAGIPRFKHAGDSYALSGLLQSMCDASNIRHLMPAIQTLAVEYQVLILRGLGRSDPKILLIPEISTWLRDNSQYF